MVLSDYPNDWGLSSASFNVPYKLLREEMGFGETEGTASVTVLIDSEDFELFIADLLPSPVKFGQIWIPVPSTAPRFPSMIVNSVTCKSADESLPVNLLGFDNDPPAGTYHNLLEVTVKYTSANKKTTDPDANDPGSWLDITCNASGEYLYSTVPGAEKKEQSASGEETTIKNPDTAITMIQPLLSWKLTWSQIPYDWFKTRLRPRLKNGIGKVNTKVFTSLFDAPAETLLFNGWDYSETKAWPRRDQQGQVTFGEDPLDVKITMNFIERNQLDENGIQVTHNHKWIPSEGWKVVLQPGKKKIYPSHNFDEIFNTKLNAGEA